MIDAPSRIYPYFVLCATKDKLLAPMQPCLGLVAGRWIFMIQIFAYRNLYIVGILVGSGIPLTIEMSEGQER